MSEAELQIIALGVLVGFLGACTGLVAAETARLKRKVEEMKEDEQ